MHKCAKCGEEFDSEKGLKVHNAQVHDGETEELKTKKEASVGNVTFRLNIRHALLLAFVVGIMTGGFFTAMAVQIGGVTGFMVNDNAQAPSGNNNGGSPSQDSVDPSKISLKNEPTLGEDDAPVTIVEFADYQCPFCRKYATETFSKIKKNYIDTGKVKYVYKDFPLTQLGHNRAPLMAEAANCAGDQGKYWELHDKMIAEQNKIAPQRTAKFDASKVTQWAEEIGLDMNAFNQCMDSDKYKSEVQSDLSEGQELGVSGTPTFFINGKKLVGAQPYSRFEQVINSELNN